MLFIVLIILALTFTITSLVFKKGMLAFAGTGTWLITVVHCFQNSAAIWDTYFSLAFLFIGIAIATVFSPLAWRETTPENEESDDVREMREETEAWNKEREMYSFLYSGKKLRRKGNSRFQRTKEG